MSPIIVTQPHTIITSTTSQNNHNTSTKPGPQAITIPFNPQQKPIHQLITPDNLNFPHSMSAIKDKTAFSTIQSQIMNNRGGQNRTGPFITDWPKPN
jgi:hypothetical protein